MASECTSLLILSKSVQQNKLPVLTLKLIKRLNAPRLNETKIATENASNWDHFRFRSNKKLEYDKELCFGLLCRILACTLTLSRQIMLIYVFLPVWFFQILYNFPFFWHLNVLVCFWAANQFSQIQLFSLEFTKRRTG